MSKIDRGSNWGYWDQLDGKAIADGEALRVRFPDGSTLDLLARVITRSAGVSDGTEIRDARSYLPVSVRGVDVLVPLYGLEAERILPVANARNT